MKPLDIIGSEPKTLSRQLHFLQLATPRHGVNGLNFEAEYRRDIFCREQPNFLLLRIHGATIS